MKNKIVCSLLVLVLSLSVVGCGESTKVEEQPKEQSEGIEVEYNENEVEVNKVENSDTEEKYVFDSKMKASMDKYLSGYKSVNVLQETSSFSVVDGNQQNKTDIAEMFFDISLANRVNLATLNTSVDEEVGMTTYYFADDNKKNIHLTRVNDGDYIEDKNLGAVIEIDYDKVKTCKELVDMLTDEQYPNDLEGKKDEDGNIVFTFTREATEDDLSGVEYNKLGTTTVEFKVRETYEGEISPISIVMQTTYFIGKTEYGVETKCSFSNFSNDKIKMPKYVSADENGVVKKKEDSSKKEKKNGEDISS